MAPREEEGTTVLRNFPYRGSILNFQVWIRVQYYFDFPVWNSSIWGRSNYVFYVPNYYVIKCITDFNYTPSVNSYPLNEEVWHFYKIVYLPLRIGEILSFEDRWIRVRYYFSTSWKLLPVWSGRNIFLNPTQVELEIEGCSDGFSNRNKLWPLLDLTVDLEGLMRWLWAGNWSLCLQKSPANAILCESIIFKMNAS